MRHRRSLLYHLGGAAAVALVALAVLLTLQFREPPEGSVPALLNRIEADPRDIAARLELGYKYQLEGRLESALQQYERVLEAEPMNSAALFNRAVIHADIGLDKRAEQGFWAVLDAEPAHVGAATRLGGLYAGKGQYRSVLVAVTPALEAQGGSAELQYLAGLANERLGDEQAAREHYEGALAASPDMAEAREGLARLDGSGD